MITVFSCKKKEEIKNLPYLLSVKNNEDSIALVYTSNLEGYIEPCGCTANPLGGISRFANVFNNIKILTKDKIALFDTGNLLFDKKNIDPIDNCQNEARLNVLLKNLTHLGLDFSIPSPLDKSKGDLYYKEIYNKYGISTELLKVFRFKEIDINIFVLNHESNKKIIEEQIIKIKSGNKKNINILVNKLELGDVPGIDIIIQTQSEDFVPKNPHQLYKGGPWVFYGSRQGQYFTAIFFNSLKSNFQEKLILDERGYLRETRILILKERIKGLNEQLITASKEKKAFLTKRIAMANEELLAIKKEADSERQLTVPNISFLSIPLDRSIDGVLTVQKDLDLYQKSLPELVKKCEENASCPKASANEAYFVGAQTCKACHEEAFNVWQKAIVTLDAKDEKGQKIKRNTGHAKAWKTLSDIKKDSDRSCIGCHSIGFMAKGGYCKTKDVGHFKDVQCESCHGAGSLHSQSGGKKELIKREVPESQCRSCHHVPHIEKYESFNYEEKLKTILGPGHGEKLLEKLKHKKS